MVYNFLYIDDNPKNNSEAITNAFNSTGHLNVKFRKPKLSWEEEFKTIREVFNEIDGLLLDLKLDEVDIENGKRAKFSGTSVAQEVRSLIRNKENNLKDLPIILISAETNLERFFDLTGLDLFDYVIKKEDLKLETYAQYISKIYSLARGYKIINEKGNKLLDILMISSLNQLDPRLVDVLNEKVTKQAHIFAGFLIRNLILKNGPLIDELTLAIRLGVDIHKSEGWPVLKERLNDFSYQGVFSEGWQRWWMWGLLKFWKESVGRKNTPREFTAKERVAMLQEKLTISGLVPIEKAKFCRSEAFWTLCVGSKIAIDTIDGFMIVNQDNFFPWQDLMYISPEEALSGMNKERWKRISSSETSRLEVLKKSSANL